MSEARGRVAGKRVVVTGAARGMGRSHAVRLAEEGADLILVDICESLPEVEYPLSTREDLDETARLVEEQGRRAVTHVVDIRDAAALSAAVADGADAIDRGDSGFVFLNGAGVLALDVADSGTKFRFGERVLLAGYQSEDDFFLILTEAMTEHGRITEPCVFLGKFEQHTTPSWCS